MEFNDINFLVVGTSSIIWPDNNEFVAIAIENGKHLQHHDAEDLWLDRFDARTLLLCEGNREWMRNESNGDAMSETVDCDVQMLHEERYMFLPKETLPPLPTTSTVEEQSSVNSVKEMVDIKRHLLETRSGLFHVELDLDYPQFNREFLVILHTSKTIRVRVPRRVFSLLARQPTTSRDNSPTR